MDDKLTMRIKRFLTNRLFILSLVFGGMFYLLLTQLFNLQVVNGESYRYKEDVTSLETLPIAAARGSIYDRLGRPLAINTPAFTAMMDANAPLTADTLGELVKLFEKNGEKMVDTFPITKTEPYQYSFAGTGTSKNRWMEDMGFTEKQFDLTAEESFAKLREKFKVGANLSNSDARKILNLCAMLYLQRYHTYDPIAIAYDIKAATVTVLEEENIRFDGIYVDTQYLRYYPEGKYFSQIVGYTGKLNGEQYEEKKEAGYARTDMIGKSGLEQSMEATLRGVNGSVDVEVMGRRLNYLPDKADPKPGDDIYLTIDRDLQRECYDVLEDALTDTLINRFMGVGATRDKDTALTLTQAFASMITGGAVSTEQIMSSMAGEDSFAIRQYVLTVSPGWTYPLNGEWGETREIIAEGIESGAITPQLMFLAMLEQGLITGGESYAQNMRDHRLDPMSEFTAKMRVGEITPQMVNLDPCTGSVVVVDVKNGDVLAAVGYPTYDANELVNNMNIDYFNKVNGDPNSPFLNRPFREARSPGSTFKMITAVTALEKGSIDMSTRILDKTEFKDAGLPYVSCWSPISHGSVNVVEALEVSCNYFFCEAAFRLGNSKLDTKLDSISALNEYMRHFGLNADTGVEIGEYGGYSDEAERIASPALKRFLRLREDPESTALRLDWYDGDTMNTSIGQGFNNYTAASMAKYITTIATRGVRYQMHLVGSVVSHDRTSVTKTQPVIEASYLPVKDSTWNAIYQGMLRVTSGVNGTGAKVFSDLPLKIAGKTGTAQENKNRNDHSSFGGFAPYDDPQIAVYVLIPFGDTKANAAVASQVAKRVFSYYFNLGENAAVGDDVNALTK